MQDLRVIGVENGALLVSSDDGERYRIPIDEVLQSRLRQSTNDNTVGRKLSPREIQDQIRSGMSAEDVASVTGMDVDYVEKYERPIIAEREHMVDSALGVAVHTAMDTGPVAGGMSFGTVIRSRLSAIGAINERWASWKDPATGWVIKLSFTSDQIDHDARWSFDPRKLTLSPLNGEATTLSQQGEVPTALIPRLRAVAASPEPDNSRFDSGAFVAEDVKEATSSSRFAPTTAQQPLRADSNQTADLLDALRRRRGEREGAAYDDEAPADPVVNPMHPSTGSIRVVDVPMPDFAEATSADFASGDDGPDDQLRATLPQPTVLPSAVLPSAAPPATGPQRTGQQPKIRKGRTSMPSWDDIVFGARPDDGA